MPTIVEQRQKRGQLVKQMRDILEKADQEARGMTAEETAAYDKIDDEQEKLGELVTRMEKQDALDTSLNAPARDLPQPAEGEGAADTDTRPFATQEYRSAYSKWVVAGNDGMTIEEKRALAASSGAAGGYITMPKSMSTRFIKELDNMTFMRQLADVQTLSEAASLGVPTLEADPADADWTHELATGTEDSTMAFGQRELDPQPLAKRIKVSNKLLRLSSRAEMLIQERLRYKFAVTNEKAFLTGDGHNKPLGVFTASSDGIPTGRDQVAAAATALAGDDFINTRYFLRAAYSNLRWVFHRNVLRDIRKLKSDANQYLWQPGLSANIPDRILDVPFTVSEYAPSSIASGKYVAILGDFSYYWIVDSVMIQVQRLNELYAETNQVGFILRMETDGMPVLSDAFVRLKMA